MVRGKWFLAGASLVMLSVAVGALMLLRRDKPAEKPDESAEAVLLPEIRLPGIVSAINVVPVPAATEGTLEEVLVAIGEEVFESQLIARVKNTGLESSHEAAKLEFERLQSRVTSLESTLIAARLEASRAAADANRSQAEYDQAQKTAARQQMLYEKGATPRLAFEKAQKEHAAAREEHELLDQVARNSEERVRTVSTELDAARIAFEEARAALEDATAELAATQVVSPVDGVLVGARAKAGEAVNRAMEDLFQIAVDLSRLRVVIEPDPGTLKRIREGMPADIRLDDDPSEVLEGAVATVEEERVTVEFPNAGAIKPGVGAQVRIKLP